MKISDDCNELLTVYRQLDSDFKSYAMYKLKSLMDEQLLLNDLRADRIKKELDSIQGEKVVDIEILRKINSKNY